MSQFFVSRKGGINSNEVNLLEGSAEKGPWYNASQFSDYQIERWLSRGWITFMMKEVR